jgi:hypothetical protein
MNETIDIIATTNPAYCSLVLRSFVRAYTDTAEGAEPEFPLAFFAVPAVLSGTISRTFAGTNSRTGLLNWINRSPEVRLELPSLLKRSVPLVRATLVFGLQTNVFTLTPEGRIHLSANRFQKEPKDPANVDLTRRHHSLAKSLGAWCGGVRSSSTVFMSIGIAP